MILASETAIAVPDIIVADGDAWHCIEPPSVEEVTPNALNDPAFLKYLAGAARLQHAIEELITWTHHHRLIAAEETKRGASAEKINEYTVQCRMWAARIEWIFARRPF